MTEVLLFAIGVLLAALGIALSIGLHEMGHMIPAKRFGVRVTQWMIGFGPTLWSRRGRETEYGVKAVPLGGYIRMIGMFPPPSDAPEGTAGRGSTGRFSLMADQARAAAWEEVPPGDEHRVFYRLSARRKVVVMMGGPTVNLLISVFVFSVLLMGIGRPTASTTVSMVVPCIPPAIASQEAATRAVSVGQSTASACTPQDNASPASQAGIRPGDRVVSADGHQVTQWSDVTERTRARPGEQVVLVLDDGQGPRSVTVQIAEAWRPVVDVDGMVTQQIARSGYIGIIPGTIYVRQPPSDVVATMWMLTERSARAILTLPARVVELAQDMAAGEPRNPDSPVSVVGIGRISGEIAAAEDPVMSKVVTLLALLGSLNLFLFLFNLLPILPLDGGHVAGALFEGSRRHLARWRGRHDPGPADVSRAMPLAYGVALVLVALSSVVILADVVNPLSING